MAVIVSPVTAVSPVASTEYSSITQYDEVMCNLTISQCMEAGMKRFEAFGKLCILLSSSASPLFRITNWYNYFCPQIIDLGSNNQRKKNIKKYSSALDLRQFVNTITAAIVENLESNGFVMPSNNNPNYETTFGDIIYLKTNEILVRDILTKTQWNYLRSLNDSANSTLHATLPVDVNRNIVCKFPRALLQAPLVEDIVKRVNVNCEKFVILTKPSE